MNIERLIELKGRKKKKKPTFLRQQSHLSKLKKTWRKPKGIDSKLRLNKKGHRKKPSPGYGSPRLVKYLNQNGFKEILIYNPKDLEKIDSKTQIPKMSKVGLKKKLQILEKALSLKLKISNIKDIQKTIDIISDNIKKKQEKKKKISEKKEKSKKELEKKVTEETREEKKPKIKEEEKKEKDKLLIKRQ